MIDFARHTLKDTKKTLLLNLEKTNLVILTQIKLQFRNSSYFFQIFKGGGSQRLFRKIGSRSSVYSSESNVRKTGSYIYEDFMPTDGTDVKVLMLALIIEKISTKLLMK